MAVGLLVFSLESIVWVVLQVNYNGRGSELEITA